MKKKLLSVVLSLAVAFTFSFAAIGTASAADKAPTGKLYVKTGTVVWNDDYSAATADIYDNMGTADDYSDDVIYASAMAADKVEKTFDYTGKITAVATWKDNYGSFVEVEDENTAKTSYIDLTGAAVNVDADYADGIEADEYLEELGNSKEGIALKDAIDYIDGITVVCPEGVTLVKGAKEKVELKNFDKKGGSLFSVLKINAAADYEAYVDGTYSLPVTVDEEALAGLKGNIAYYTYYWFGGWQYLYANDVIGTPDAAKVAINVTDDTDFDYLSVQAMDAKTDLGKDVIATPPNTDVDLYPAFTYDGKDHAVQLTTKGLTAEYYVWNAKTSKYEKTDALSIKNQGTYKFAVKVTHEGKYKDVTSGMLEFGFKINKKNAYLGFNYKMKTVVEGTELDLDELIDVRDAVDSDVEALKAALPEFYSVKGYDVTKKAGDVVELRFAENTAGNPTDEQKTLVGNYKWTIAGDTTTINVVAKEKAANEITAPAVSKIYNVGNAKATKAAHKLTLKASAAYGTVKFTKKTGNSKIKVASDGKVTVKKGLKKGEYKIAIKCTVAAGEDYQGAVEYTTLRIKVKK